MQLWVQFWVSVLRDFNPATDEYHADLCARVLGQLGMSNSILLSNPRQTRSAEQQCDTDFPQRKVPRKLSPDGCGLHPRKPSETLAFTGGHDCGPNNATIGASQYLQVGASDLSVAADEYLESDDPDSLD